MNGDFGEKLQAILNNPEMMQKISAIADSFSDEKQEPPREPEKREPEKKDIPAGLFKNQTAADPRIALLHSIKPFLHEEKRPKVELLAKAVSMAGLLDIFNIGK